MAEREARLLKVYARVAMASTLLLVGTALVLLGAAYFNKGIPVPGSGLLSFSPASESCDRVAGDMHVVREDGRDLTASQEMQEPGDSGLTAFGRFSLGWAESRSVFIAINPERSNLARARAWVDTDAGSYVGEFLEGSSSLHKHDDRICFDLGVDWEGSVERWPGALRLE